MAVTMDTQPGINGTARTVAPVVALSRRTIDSVLVSLGVVVAVVLAVAGGLLTWGATFSRDYVERELTSQQIFFPPAEALEAEGRTDLLGFAGTQVTNGTDAKAYASYIDHHLDDVADGKTYAELGGPEREAKAAVAAARESGASEAEIADLQAAADTISGQRATLFKGETLRGLLLSTYAWDTIGRIAAIASIAALVAAGVMVVLSTLGLVHLRKISTT